MIKLRIKTFESPQGEIEIPMKDGELLSEAVNRSLEGIPLGDHLPEEVFQVLVNGHKIESDFWTHTKLIENDNVLIAPLLKDDPGSIFKQIVTLVVVAVVNYYTAGIAGALMTAGAAIATTLALNALIPPPVPDAGALHSGDLGESQMYSVTSQSNAVRRFATVPKVYGSHRMFPVVAANPYTQIEVDPETGELVQFLYAIYDFGFGPNYVHSFKIGDTPIGEYSDIFYNIVDPLKPDVSEGPWDNQSIKEFQYYKSDVGTESLSVTIDGNRDDGDVLDSYQVIRNAAANPNSVKQDIAINFTCPSGLFSFTPSGAIKERTIKLEIHFSKVGEDSWKGFNDLDWVESYTATGGDQIRDKTAFRPWPMTPTVGGPDYLWGGGEYLELNHPSTDPYTSLYGRPAVYLQTGGGQSNLYNLYQVGIPAGATYVILQEDDRIIAGSTLWANGEAIGVVYNSAAYGTAEGFTFRKYNLASPTTKDLYLMNFASQGGTNIPIPFDPNLPLDIFPYSYGDVKELVTLQADFGVNGQFHITRASRTAAYSSFKFTPKEIGEYKIRISRTSSTSIYTSQVQDGLSLLNIQTRGDVVPIVTDKRHTFVEVKIRATNQLNGAIQNLSATCESAIEVYDDVSETWNKQLTQNPAWIFADLMTGQINKRAIPKSRLDMDSIVEWAEFCDEIPTAPSNIDPYTTPRFRTSFLLDYTTTLQEVIGQVTSAAQAGFNVIDGNYGVLVDKNKTVPVQVFTPRNSANFSSNRNYNRKPHGIRVKFIEPSKDWQTTELIVYDDGYTEINAEQNELDELIAFGCTSSEQAWRFGRYMLAQNRLRQENITIKVDFEHLVCTRGDYVQITQDAMKVGGSPARVRTVSGIQITIDDSLETVAGSYGYVFRSAAGTIVTDTLTVINSNTFDLDGTIPAIGDLIIIGLVDSIVYDCIVKSITPSEDLTAIISLVEKADAVYDSETLALFPDYDPELSLTVDADFQAPGEVLDLQITDNAYDCNADNSGYLYYMDLTWESPTNATYEFFDVFVNNSKGFKKVDSIRTSVFRYVVDGDDLDLLHSFKIIAVSASGKKLNLIDVTGVSETPSSKTTAPSDVAKLSSDITNEVIQFSWDKIADCDLSEYIIRYSPELTATWESSVPLLVTSKDLTTASAQARTGCYLIKAVDYAGNKSINAAKTITTIPNLFNLNIIETKTDFPDLLGTFDRAEKSSGALILQQEIVGGLGTGEFYEEGFYYYETFLDLGEIYTVRLQSLIQAEGITDEDLMVSWVTLTDVLKLANADSADWDVEAQYRSTDAFNTMAEWTTMASVDPLSEGNQDNFTEWRKFIMGDATGRIFQFRLKLLSNRATVTPRVFDGTIRADMPDRVESYNDIIAPDTGYSVVYDPAFKGPGTSPNIQVSIDGASSGDYWVITSKSLTGFDIQFYNSSDVAVQRQFDAAIKGYGRKATAII